MFKHLKPFYNSKEMSILMMINEIELIYLNGFNSAFLISKLHVLISSFKGFMYMNQMCYFNMPCFYDLNWDSFNYLVIKMSSCSTWFNFFKLWWRLNDFEWLLNYKCDDVVLIDDLVKMAFDLCISSLYELLMWWGNYIGCYCTINNRELD